MLSLLFILFSTHYGAVIYDQPVAIIIFRTICSGIVI